MIALLKIGPKVPVPPDVRENLFEHEGIRYVLFEVEGSAPTKGVCWRRGVALAFFDTRSDALAAVLEGRA